MKIFVVIPLVLFSVYAHSQLVSTSGQINVIQTAVPFLLITPDARAGAMGDAGCASTPDVFSNYWNASKNAFAENNFGASVAYTPWLRALVPDISLTEISTYGRIEGKNVFGFSGRYFGDIGSTGYYRPHEEAYLISYARWISSRFSLGISARKIHSDLLGPFTIGAVSYSPADAFSGDISCFWKDTLMLQKKPSELAWAVNISNVGPKVKYANGTLPDDFLPQSLRVGISYKVNLNGRNSIELACDVNKLLVPTPPLYQMDSTGNPVYGLNGRPVILSGKDPVRTVGNALYTSFYDAPGGFKEELREIVLASGVEYCYRKIVSLRIGYFYEHETKGARKYFTFGIGAKYAGFGLDFSYLIPTEQRHPLMNTMRFTILYEFMKRKNVPKKKDGPHFLK